MAHAPSGRNHRVKPETELNLVPMIDMVTNLMFFLMMFASIVPVVMIDAPLPKIASTAEEVRKAKDDQNKLELNLFINKSGFEIKGTNVSAKSFPIAADGKFPFADLHSFLVTLHAKRPTDKALTMMPADDTSYDVMVQVMDATRELVQGDPGYQPVPPDIAQKPESMQFNRLFPDVSIGGV